MNSAEGNVWRRVMKSRHIDSLVDNLQAHPVATSVLCSVGNIIAAVGLENSWGTRWWPGFLVVIMVCTSVAATVAERTKTLRSLRTTSKVIQKLLAALAEESVAQGKHVRANIMLCNTSCSRRKVDRATAYNMEDDADRELEIDFGAGISGKAAHHRKAVIADRDDDWGLSLEERAMVRKSIKTILSTPIFNPEDQRKHPLIGTLQLDSDEPRHVLGWNQRTIARAQTFADVIALTLGVKM